MNWEQFQAILWLRWRLGRNQFSRRGPLQAVLTILIVVMLGAGGAGFGLGGFLAGLLGLGHAPPEVLLLVWDGVLCVFLFFWLMGVMVEIQRSEAIDLPKLLTLPVTLQQVFVINYVASHVTPSLVLLLPGMMGLAAGLTLSIGPRMALVAPLALSFVFTISAWTYCLRGWLAALMINKRRRRTVVLVLTLFFVFVMQFPNLLVNSHVFRHYTQTLGKHRKAQSEELAGMAGLSETFVQAHLALPPGWVGYGAFKLARHDAWPALGATAAGCLIGALGLMRAYRMTLRFYTGAEARSEARAAPKSKLATPQGWLLVEGGLPCLAEDTAGLTLATFRGLLRAPEMKMALVMPVVVGAAMGSLHFTVAKNAPSPFLAAFGATAAALLAAFSFAPTMGNAFGLDRAGFRTLVLLPTLRRKILLAKNLAYCPFVLGVAAMLLALAKFLLHSSLSDTLAGLVQALIAFLLFSLLGNLLSALFPYRFAPGTLQAKRPKAIIFVGVFITLLVVPLVALPVVIPPGLELLCSAEGWVPAWLPVNLAASCVVFVAAAGLYALLLPLEARLLQRREQAILQAVTEEIE